jgi:hypothetical protein
MRAEFYKPGHGLRGVTLLGASLTGHLGKIQTDCAGLTLGLRFCIAKRLLDHSLSSETLIPGGGAITNRCLQP